MVKNQQSNTTDANHFTKSLSFTSVKLSEVLKKDIRFEGSLYNSEAIANRSLIENGKWETKKLISQEDVEGFVNEAFYPGRFKRTYIDQSNPEAVGFIGSSEMLNMFPKPEKFLSRELNGIDDYKVAEDTILLSRSGTIGRATLVKGQLKEFLISEHSIRLICNEFPGYVYTFLISSVGKNLITTNTYGAVVDQIEPEHLYDVEIPNPSSEIKKSINSRIIDSFKLRDESNSLIKQAEEQLLNALGLPQNPADLIEELKDDMHDLKHFEIKLSNYAERLEASYHLPILDLILNELENNSDEIILLGNDSITNEIILPSRFKRVFVEKEFGTKLVGGRDISELVPSTEKYLSNEYHREQIKEQLGIRENSIIVTARGTLGKTTFAPKHFEGWAISDNLMQVVPASDDLAGYLYIFLNSNYGYELITRYTYGGVVDALEIEHLANVPIPMLKDRELQKNINYLALSAKKKRYEAYTLEQEALGVFNRDVLGIM
ncbi:restriction endonuclease subunit S [Virgibacillus halodenitrificans]|uniref:restriction endonuclease subunit S n=1 Tax=Virgibacillus halodenitrificans TaxID=1482 RepID=UPI001EECF8D0|nr:restriction endonuclease subunit S [Virgibacillus halodenitrificans]MCG1027612.1 restriction endonuclease subunit S [Virgibacillus halodenitrificans]